MALRDSDPEIADIIKNEEERQCNNINLIASENYISKNALEAQGCVLTNKYAEGYPGKRYYGGCQYIDNLEEVAISRAKDLFGAEHANVQVVSGSTANMAAYMALIEYGDSFMGMNLAHGGHLTHGSPVSFSSKLYRPVFYGVSKETGWVDYDEVEKIAIENKPKMIMVGSSSYPRKLDYERFRQIADKINAKLVVDMAHVAGLIAAGVYPSPMPYADVVTSTTHKTLRGPRGGLVLCKEEYAAAIDKSVFPGLQGGPLMHIVAAKAMAFQEAKQPQFIEYQKTVLENARVLAEELMAQGLNVVTGGTDKHLVVVDLTSTDITGKVAEAALGEVSITVNKNSVPFDPKPAAVTSGIRLGTPAITSRGFGPDETRRIAQLTAKVLSNLDDKNVYQQVRDEVAQMNSRFPTPGITA
ncbi:MAG: serine hydroxymethyltransferase [Chloroflexi bacterium]|nr:serine hydroxymethyltransferase [Chloroflexota bacterium]